MAYMSQEKKKQLLPGIAAAVPKGWKYTVSVRDHSTLVLTIRQAPVDLVAMVRERRLQWNKDKGYETDFSRTYYEGLNTYHLDGHFSGEMLETFEKIKAAMMAGNHDNSDPMTDYFDVGWYIDIKLGSFESAFEHILTKPEPNFAQAWPLEKPKKAAKSDAETGDYSMYLPADFSMLSPARKAWATRKARALAGL